jgi:diguanylate cyclase (GGDEF)-like protein
LRSSDFFGRIGGEEFAVLLPQTDAAGSLEVAERLRLAVAGIRLPLATGQVISVTTSIGSTQLWPSDAALDAALSRADKALYAAKSHGRNQTQELLSEPGASDSAVPDAVAS